MNEIHALSGAYTVDALDDLERAQFDVHLARCAPCRAEVASLREATALLGGVHAMPPASGVRGQVLAQIRTVRPLPPASRPAVLARRWPGRLLAAAAAILVVGLGAVLTQPWTHESMSMVDRVLNAGDVVSHQVALPTGGAVTVANSASLGRAVLLTRGLADPPSGRTYELWLQSPDGVMHPAGLIGSGGDQSVVLTGDSSDATGAGISTEPTGGSRQPTTAPIAVFDFGHLR